MKNLSVLLLLLVLFCNCMASELKVKTEKAIVAGRIRNIKPTDPKVLSVIYCDPLDDGNDRQAVTIADDGTFHTQYTPSWEHNITINYNKHFINVYLAPSDSLFIDIDMERFRNDDFTAITVSGKCHEFNTQLPNFYNTLSRLEYPNFDITLSPVEFIADFRLKYDKGCRLIDSIASKNKIMPKLTEWAKRDLLYSYANYILDYGIGDAKKSAEVFRNEIFDTDNANNFTTMMFSYHLTAMWSKMVNCDAKLMEYAKQKNIDSMLVQGFKCAEQLPPSMCRDFILYDFADRLAQEEPSIINILPKGYFTNNFFVDYLTRKTAAIPEFKSVTLDQVQYHGKDAKEITQADIISYLASQHPSKVIYIDVFATWCGPCVAEFAPAKELHKLFENKDVVFVNLCLASDKQKWQECIVKHDLHGENFFFDQDATQLFISNYKLSGYPSYLLVDKKGRVVTNQAPRPSNLTKAAEAIQALLESDK